ncbi:peptidase associated/transthyretin-like domain-containing protein [Pedobacter agri]|uniref:Uncharacterized protein n=1 Tax=Pedobacter agri TaxID=454586 RepID=A0A9X3I852_9SPHI|nr:hypothetical protein [Pedobacter agri]MCX3263143.1 hypothetical protein [Pedobacter agri]
MRHKLYQIKKLKRLPLRQLVVLVSMLIPFSPGYVEAKTTKAPLMRISIREISVSGKVVDEKGIALPGVSVQIKGLPLEP